jgi:lipopolysaccharide/colanic/teichoic acid biosynthesis glycosyltransferase
MLKRIFDIISSGIVLILISPLIIPIMIILKLTGEGKIFYVQERIGENRKSFGLLKFATMLENSPNMTGGEVTSGKDPRVLPVGRFLRKTKINELPQLLNIIKGDMSVVGPRPMTPRNFSYYSLDIQEKIKDLKPGLTGIGSIVFRDEESILAKSDKPHLDCFKEDIAPFKGALESWYWEKKSFLLDLQLVFITIYVIVFPNSKIISKLYKDLPKNKQFI